MTSSPLWPAYLKPSPNPRDTWEAYQRQSRETKDGKVPEPKFKEGK